MSIDIRINVFFPGLKTNTCLTTLEIYLYSSLPPACDGIVDILKQNKTLQYLQIGCFEFFDLFDMFEEDIELSEETVLRMNITELRDIVKALNENTTLQHLKLWIGRQNASSFIEANYPELTLDPRISWL